MATKRKRKRPARRRQKSAGLAQKLLVAASLVMIVLCAASVTWSFFVRRSNDGGKGRFTVEILNGVGASGIAHEAKRALLQRGIDVIAVGNAPHFDFQESVLIARKPGADVARLGEVLGCRNVVVQVKEDAIEDASLILGADYRRLNIEWDE